MENKEDLQNILNDINYLFGKVFLYNTKLLRLCNKNDYKPTYQEIFDFYITSNAMSLLKNFTFEYVESPGIFLNARCVIEGLALKKAFETGYFNNVNLELLMEQDAIIEYKEYEKFRDYYHLFLIPEDLKSAYDKSCDFYRNTLSEISEKQLNNIINSQIPFACNPKLSFLKIVRDNLGESMATGYSLLSLMIHPTSNEAKISCEKIVYLLKIIKIIEVEYANLPLEIDLIEYSNLILTSNLAKSFLESIKMEFDDLEKIINNFKENFGNNYVSDTFHAICMTIQEMAFDTIFGFNEQVKSKWKILIEMLSEFFEVYINNGDTDCSYRILQYHTIVAVARVTNMETEKQNAISQAYEYYKKKYPNGIGIEEFSRKFETTTGYTINEKGKIKTLTQLVIHFTDLLTGDNKDSPINYSIKLNYIEAQMLSHANGYLWFANSGAWSDINNIFVLFNQIISFICICMSGLFKKLYKDDRQYKYKKISNLLKHSASHIIDNTNNLYELLLKRNVTFGEM